MMKYQVVIENSIDKLEAEVNKLLSEWWLPQGVISMMVAQNFEQRYGRISVILQTSSFLFAQALVKD